METVMSALLAHVRQRILAELVTILVDKMSHRVLPARPGVPSTADAHMHKLK